MTFYVGTMKDNSGTLVIGYEVRSRSAVGGERRHFSREAQHPSSLARARSECAAEAARLETEAAGNRARAKR